MAKKPKRITDPEASEQRVDPTWRYVGLLSVFAILLVVSIFTVMIPELTDDGEGDEADAAGAVTTDEAPADAPAPATPTAP